MGAVKKAPRAETPNLDAVRGSLNEISLRAGRIIAISSTLDRDFLDVVIEGLPKDDRIEHEIFLTYCDALKRAATDIDELTERAFAATRGEAVA